jgi:ketosteroid isomerase-like protein
MITARDTLAAYEARINLQDFDQLVPLFSAEAVFWFNDGSFIGIDAIRAAFEATWARVPGEIYTLTDKLWLAESDTAAACLYRFHWTAIVDSKPVSGHGRGTTVLRREAETWRIIHEHLSGEPQ